MQRRHQPFALRVSEMFAAPQIHQDTRFLLTDQAQDLRCIKCKTISNLQNESCLYSDIDSNFDTELPIQVLGFQVDWRQLRVGYWDTLVLC